MRKAFLCLVTNEPQDPWSIINDLVITNTMTEFEAKCIMWELINEREIILTSDRKLVRGNR